jgi:acetylglutamate kinase
MALNVNADDAAAAVAAALGAAELLFVSNVAGVLDAGAVLEGVEAGEVEALIAEGTANGGMAPKLRAAARAARSVGRVRIGGLEMLDDPGAGTRVGAAATVKYEAEVVTR